MNGQAFPVLLVYPLYLGPGNSSWLKDYVISWSRMIKDEKYKRRLYVEQS